MNDHDLPYVAMPKLVGAPAYARPYVSVVSTERPFDPDELPISAAMTDEERDAIETLPREVWRPGGGISVASVAIRPAAGSDSVGAQQHEIRPSRFSVRALTERLKGGS